MLFYQNEMHMNLILLLFIPIFFPLIHEKTFTCKLPQLHLGCLCEQMGANILIWESYSLPLVDSFPSALESMNQKGPNLHG